MKKSDLSHWEEKLPSTYETLIQGFHAGMTVAEMVDHLGMRMTVPDKIKDIKIGSFTPDMFQHSSGAHFWKKPVSKRFIYPELATALCDPDIAAVQLSAGYIMDPRHPTLEMLARVAQAQFIGFQVRMGELTSKNLFARLKTLRTPAFYEKLRGSSFVVQNRLQDLMPKIIPYFEGTKHEFSVKSVDSALGKAYGRTGKPKNAETFFANPNKHGVFAVTDLQRTSLKFSKSGKIARETLLEDYTNVRNILTIALLSGELGIVIDKSDHCEISDQVLYPTSDRPSDLYPVFKTNGKIYHAGPYGSHLTAPLEIQIPVLEDYLIEQTHKAYETYRDIKGDNDEARRLRSLQNQVRVGLFNSGLPESIQSLRRDYLKTGNAPKDDSFAVFLNKNDMFANELSIRKRAIEVAQKEFPEREKQWRSDLAEFDPFNSKNHTSEVFKQSMRDIIKLPKADQATAKQDQATIIPFETVTQKKTYAAPAMNS